VMIPMMVIFFISALAETNRPPFDLPEAESELVAGYQVEYSSTPFLLFMIGELANIVLMCAMISLMFFGGWQAPIDFAFVHDWPAQAQSFYGFMWFFAKVIFFFFLFAMVKAIVPRYRYDQLMRLGWKVFLPTSLVAVALVAGWRVYGGFGG
jgi:NADH-quinone oxidoreductase subunit H